jgi:O-antigen/teichoic acid export membrane protein
VRGAVTPGAYGGIAIIQGESVSATTVLATVRGRLAAQWAQPLYRSGYLLVLNSLVTAVLGLGFWLLAARLYTPTVIGINSTTISAMMLIAGAAQLNLMSSLLRFVPTAGRHAGRMIGRSHALGATLSALVAVVYLLGLHRWTPALSAFLGQVPVALSFVAATAGWAVLVMQASALVALGRAGATTVSNQAFNFLKLVLLLPFVILLPRSGVWFAWTAAMAAVVAGTTWFIFRRALRGFAASSPEVPTYLPSFHDLARFAGPDYVAALAWIGCTALAPILVFNLSDAEHAAVFNLAWSICFTLYGVPAALGQSLVAHGVRDPARLREHHRKILVSSLALLAPVVAVLVVFAPLVLAPFGEWYASEGSATLRLLALSALPNTVVALTVSRARADRRMTVVVTTMVELCMIVLGLTWWLVPRMGIVAGALAWMVGQSVVVAGIEIMRRLEKTGARR